MPAMDKLSSSLSLRTKKKYHPAILATMKLAHTKMDCYYSLTDASAVYRIAMVLHPGMKLEYFRQHKWLDEWIEQAENMVREEYIGSYEKKNGEAADRKAKSVTEDAVMVFGDLSVTAARVSEIDDYLRLPVEPVSDPLKWWNDNCHMYPSLSRMALDYLSVPGTSMCFFFYIY
jgi:hypothetical protein